MDSPSPITRRTAMKGVAVVGAAVAAVTAGASTASAAGPSWSLPYPRVHMGVGVYGQGYGPSNPKNAYTVAYYRGSVKNIQRRLGLAQDGYIGPATDRAIRNFQRSNRLTVDGIPGAATLHKMGMRLIVGE